ncbi:aldehyde dehydrogenase [Suillus paluster]|uniref:aldehyde dehydrogenase n=1 Tax=Suillus paluster TaxID=48578 RepID=UPI001B866530|nr:aldehyde dehydrogenase [Suillus paluster]KAG1752570.1 aldehyde dehydrogenase [Suillus paluster]
MRIAADGITACLQRKGSLFQDHYRRPLSFIQWKEKTPPLAASDHETITVTNPANGKQLCTVDAASIEEVEWAVSHAQATFDSGIWSKASSMHRSSVLSRLADSLQRCIPDMARIETMQTGRPIREMKAQMARLPDWLYYYAALLRTNQGFVAPTQGKLLNYIQRVPLGVVAQITPFNHPLFIAIKKLAPALAAGNSVIVKPSELTPVSLLEFANITQEVGLPDGVLTILPGYGHTTGRQLASHSLVRKVDITAGTQTGRALGAIVGSNLAAFTAELGGKAPILIFDDADVISAVNGVAFAAFVASGQTCISGTRIIIQENIYESFMTAFLKKVESITQQMGNPMDKRCSMGSVISPRHLDRIDGMVARRQSGTILTGGKRMMGKSSLDDFDFSLGNFYPPTVISDVDVNHELWQEEIFGPVVVVKKFSTELEGVRLANASKYGLGAGVWTQNLSRAHRVAADIDAGLVWVNTHHRNDPSSPWGGMKESGIGRENGIEALEAYSQSKSIIVNVAPPDESRQTDDWFSGEQRRYG